MSLTDQEPKPIRVGSFPYAPGFNPYQRLFTNALEEVGLIVQRIPPEKWWPLSKACRQPIDILHLDWHYDWYRGKNWLTRTLKRIMYLRGLRQFERLPVIWTAHNLAAHDVSSSGRSAARDDHRMTQALIDHCRGIMVMSAASEQLLRERYHLAETTHVVQVPHGHYIDAYPNTTSRKESRMTLGLDENARVYLSLGALRPYKGHRELISAFARVANDGDQLLIAGMSLDASYADTLAALVASQAEPIRDRIRLEIGEIADDRLQLYFGAADIAVLPFSDILNSGSLLLAMSFGLPVVAPSIGSIPEIVIEQYHVGYSPQNDDGLQQALLEAKRRFCPPGGQASNSAQEHQVQSRAIIDQTRQRYEWTNSAAKLADFYRALLRGEHRTRHAVGDPTRQET